MAAQGIARVIGKVAAGLALVIGLYFAAALIGSIIGTNADWREPDKGVTIYVETNGIHTALILPTENAQHSWSAALPAEHLSDPRYRGQWLGFSWGNRRFFLETKTWADVKPGTLASVVVGDGQSLIHVYHYQDAQIRTGPYIRPLRISTEQYRALVVRIQAGFIDAQNPVPIPGYGPNDVFYEGRERYSLVTTCNTWTGDVLRGIGVRVGLWTPLAGGVMRWFPRFQKYKSKKVV